VSTETERKSVREAEAAAVAVTEDIPPTPQPRRPGFINYLHSSVAIPLIYLYTFVMGSISLMLSVYDPKGKRQHWCAQVWCRLIARTTGSQVRVHGLENIRPGTSYVFLSSHQSYMDIPAMLGYLPVQLRIAAKKILFKIPFMGWHLARAGHIPVDRSSTQTAVATMQKAADKIREGICAFVFPEGTRSPDGALHAFKKGGFKLAMQARVPIVPVTIIGSRQVLPKNSIIFRPGPIDMYVDEPIQTANLKDEDLEELMRTVRAQMARHFRDQAGADFSV
jgi:1-acyl-sn-glycerol-3-phosphate acyltransferase